MSTKPDLKKWMTGAWVGGDSSRVLMELRYDIRKSWNCMLGRVSVVYLFLNPPLRKYILYVCSRPGEFVTTSHNRKTKETSQIAHGSSSGMVKSLGHVTHLGLHRTDAREEPSDACKTVVQTWWSTFDHLVSDGIVQTCHNASIRDSGALTAA